MDQLAAHRQALDVFASVLANVRDDQLGGPTPCADWDVQALIDHVVQGNAWVAALAEQPVGDLPQGRDAAFARTAEAAQAVFAASDGLTRTFNLPFGAFPGTAFIGLRTTDVLTHAWDLAKATGQPTDLAPDLAAEALEASRMRIQPAFRGPGMPFGPEQPCGDDRPVADRLAAFLGRSVD
jgi:uncharacterized protein (TIGR03086 family)